MQIFLYKEVILEYIQIDLSDRSFEDLQIFAGEHDKNLEILKKHFKTEFILRSHILKFEKNEQEPVIREVVNACFSLIDQQKRLHFQDVSYLISLGKKHQLQRFQTKQLSPVGKTRSGKLIYPKTLGQAILCDAFKEHDVIFATGVAGTGKTYLSVAYAVTLLRQEKIEKIILTRPAVEAGESLGFLPGDMKEKVDPYLRPLYDALYDMLGIETVEKYIERQIIEIAPLAFMRGRTLNDAVVILDEAQNSTRAQMKMFLTRMGKNTKMMINGDITQIDLIKKQDSGLMEACAILQNIPEIAIVELATEDVVRNPIVQKIIERYAKIEK